MTRPLPVLPLRDVVVFPGMVSTLFVARPTSVRAVDALSVRAGRKLIVCNQKTADVADPGPQDLHAVGTLVRIIQVVRLPEDMRKVVVEGEARVDLSTLRLRNDRLEAEPRTIAETPGGDRARRLRLAILDVLGELSDLDAEQSPDPTELDELEGGAFADRLAADLDLPIEDRQLLLEASSVAVRLEFLLRQLELRRDRLRLDERIRQRLQEQLERNQKQYLLGEKLRAIRSEMGQEDEDELDALEREIEARALPAEVAARASAELRRLRKMPPVSAETTVARGWLDWVLALPWGVVRTPETAPDRLRARLDAQHAGLERVKERIVEYLAVHALTGRPPATRLCLVGPPGVGKTSLARSIADALQLDFVRQSLGGVRDEAEIRGHRRTYVGAMPGRIVQGLRRAGSFNPVFLLDEIDKMGTDMRGDPAAALLEVLDPEQNGAFRDHYLDLDLDLRGVLFITTANTLHDIPEPLRDRLEVIELGGYSETEKLDIATHYLLPRLHERTGVAQGSVRLSEATLRQLIRAYTREVGVRELEQRLEALLRKQAVQVLAGADAPVEPTPETLPQWLGPPRYRFAPAVTRNRPAGVVCGLAWTAAGGDVLLTEALALPGKGRLEITGKLGEVMQESIRAALTWVRSRAVCLGLDIDFWKRTELHVHLPEGAVPKDGPSAGITVAVAIVSALLDRPTPPDLAMTGEITLSGLVLPVGGLREKLLAAQRHGIGTVLLPERNAEHLDDVPEETRAALSIVPVGHMDDVVRHLFPDLQLVEIPPAVHDQPRSAEPPSA